MLPTGHLAATYILVRAGSAISQPLSLSETILVLASGAILDLDLLGSIFLKKPHHSLLTHTPLAIFLVWTTLVLVFGPDLSLTAKILILASLLLHLFLDQLVDWEVQKKWSGLEQAAKINWLYPFKTVRAPDRKSVV